MKHISLRHSSLGVLALAGVVAASSAQSPLLRPSAQRESPVPGVAHLMAFGSRSTAQQRSATASKLDGTLADLARHAYLARPGHVLEDLHSLSPAARFAQSGPNAEPLVLVDAVTRGDPQRLKAVLVSLGLEHPSVYSNDVSGWLPLRQIEAATARAELHSLRAAMPHTRAGAVTSQGDFVQGSATLRATWPTLDGTGVTVGVLSDSFNCYAVYAKPGSGVPASGPAGYASNGFTADAAKDESTGDLPATVTVLEEAGQIINQTCLDYGKPQQLPYADEGRAMLQIVHDVAPGASLAFHTAVEGEADFANGITALAASGARVIADDVGYFDEPFFQDGIAAQAIDNVEAKGVAYFSAAGNSGQLAYDNLAPHFNTPSTSPAGEMLLNFDTSNMTTATALPITIGSAANNTGLVPGEFVAVVVEWDQPYVTGAPASPGASSRIDVCVTGVSGTDTIVNGITGNSVTTCTGPNSTGVDPLQILIIGNPANAAGNTGPETLSLVIGLMNGSPAPGRIKIAVDDNGAGSTINAFDTQGGTVHGHPGAAGAMAVGAAFFFRTPACGTSPAVVESFSSKGGDPILFDTSGTRLGLPQYRQKPDIVGPDGTNNTFLGFLANATGGGLIGCQNNRSLPSFFGTSAATPHLAGVAALMLHANSAITPTLIYAAMKASAAPMGGAPPMQVGAGFIQADAALALLPPAAPTISLAPTSTTVGMSSTLTWSGINVTGCTASGSWSGALAVSGTQTITPTAAGNLTYTLTCSNAAGSATNAAILAVAPFACSFACPMSSRGGGGGLDAAALLALAGLAGARLLRRRAMLLKAASRRASDQAFSAARAASSASPFGVPHPVHGSQPTAAW